MPTMNNKMNNLYHADELISTFSTSAKPVPGEHLSDNEFIHYANGNCNPAEEEAIDAHLGLARGMIAEALEWRRDGPPRSPIKGDELASELGIERGPDLGMLIEEIEAAVFAREVNNRDDALAFARTIRES